MQRGWEPGGKPWASNDNRPYWQRFNAEKLFSDLFRVWFWAMIGVGVPYVIFQVVRGWL